MDSTTRDDEFKGLRILRNLSETESFSCHCGSVFKTPSRLQEHYAIFHSCSSIFVDLNGDVLWRDYNPNKKKTTRRKVGPLCYQKMLSTRLSSIEEESLTEDGDEGNKMVNANVPPQSMSFSNPAIQSENVREPERITRENDPISSKEPAFCSEQCLTVSHDPGILENRNAVVEQQNLHNQCMSLTNNLETGELVDDCGGSGSCNAAAKNLSLPSPNIITRQIAEEILPSSERTKVGMGHFHLQDEENNSVQTNQNYTNVFSQNLTCPTGNFEIDNVRLKKCQIEIDMNMNALEKSASHRSVNFQSHGEEMYGNWSVVKCEPVGEIDTAGISRFSGHHAQNFIYKGLELDENCSTAYDQRSLETLNTSPVMRNESLKETFSQINSFSREEESQDTVRMENMDNEMRRETVQMIPMKIEDGAYNYNTRNIPFNIHENTFDILSSSSSSIMTHFHNDHDRDPDQDDDDIYSSCQETVLGSMAKSPELPSDDMETGSTMHENTSRRRTKRKKSFDVSKTELTRSLRSLPGRPKRFCN